MLCSENHHLCEPGDPRLETVAVDSDRAADFKPVQERFKDAQAAFYRNIGTDFSEPQRKSPSLFRKSLLRFGNVEVFNTYQAQQSSVLVETGPFLGHY